MGKCTQALYGDYPRSVINCFVEAEADSLTDWNLNAVPILQRIGQAVGV